MTKTIRIGAGAAWWGDRVEPAQWNAERGDLDYLCFETMAEATVSAAQVRARRDPSFEGYDTYLDDRMRAVLPGCMKRGTKIISNQGWINPEAAAKRVVHWLRELGHTGVKVAAVNGSLITDRVLGMTDRILENGQPTATLKPTLISAEAYLGAEPIVQALKEGAQIVITGRVADPSIFMAPMAFEFGWDPLDHVHLGRGNGLGHLLECGAQVTGGYFSDPGFKDVPEPWNFGFPIAEVDADGNATLSKVAGTGGAITLQTVKEQMLYEVHDPANYLTPDVVVDFTTAQLEQVGPDRVRVTHIGSKPRTAKNVARNMHGRTWTYLKCGVAPSPPGEPGQPALFDSTYRSQIRRSQPTRSRPSGSKRPPRGGARASGNTWAMAWRFRSMSARA
jgi:hypothetical protein